MAGTVDWFRQDREQVLWDAEDSGRVVRLIREERGWSRSQLAEAAGVSHGDVTQFEAGAVAPSQPMLVRLTRAMGFHS